MQLEPNNDSVGRADSSAPAGEILAVTFESITFSDGTVISLDQSDVVVLVGPNNAGKSVALRQLLEHIGPANPQTVIKAVSRRRKGTADQLREFLNQHALKSEAKGQLTYKEMGFSVLDRQLDHIWDHDLGRIWPLFCKVILTENRIRGSNSQEAISTLDEPPSHPVHILYDDDRVEKRISTYFRRAFGKDLIVYHGGGKKIPLLVGERPELEPGEDRLSASYKDRLLASAVALETQGDGMRSFASVVLHMLAADTQSILLLDEPEAFLHPPQARLLGEYIAKERPPQSQLFIATHSFDVLQGLLNVATKHLRVLRMQRDGNVNHVKELDKDRARTISTDPLMKFSGVLSGAFHERVIICESDADCMFYSAILDLPQIHGNQQPDVLFVHAGGKHRMAALAEALRDLDIPVDVIADIDILNDEEVLRRIVDALGGDCISIQRQARPLKAAIEQRKPWLNAPEVVKEVQEVLSEAPPTGDFSKQLRKKVLAIFRKASPWDAVKEAGQAAIPPGQATQHLNALKDLCEKCGLWIVPVGELEGFCKSEGNKGPRWVQKVIETRDLAADPELGPARDFVRQVWNSRGPKIQQPSG